ncbi:calmodulin-dependent protein kinase [Gigaspora margarita]|uniref:Calmodulin-dependent protein kinase n=1 Tax=Gigaspora margarita TaxID=4874 RepID=A0A8H4ELF2_GIGMA|nr:calmodulin-dependent protein kinase [Gigaspora margarita]
MTILEYVDGGTLRQYLEQIFNKMKWNDKLYLAKQIANAINVGVLLWEISSGTIPFESESPFDYDCLIAIIHGNRESEVIGTPRKYSLIHKDCWCHDANKRPSIQYVVAHLNKIVIVEEFEEYAMEEDGSNPSFIFNQFAYQYYNFSMIGYFHEHGIGTDVDYNKAFWMYKLSSEIDIKNILKNNLNNLSLLDNFNVNNYIIGKISLGLLYSVRKGVDMDKPLAFK